MEKMKKYELTTNTIVHMGRTLYQIKALMNFGIIRAGELGGYIESEKNLSQEGNAWVGGDTTVSGNTRVSRNADYTTIKGFGTKYRNTTFFRCEDGNVRVVCGCFYGTIDEFREQVKRTRAGKIAEEYLMIADLMEFHFREENTNDM